MLTEEVCTNDRLADIGQDESPVKGSLEAKVERQNTFAKVEITKPFVALRGSPFFRI